MQYLWRAQLFAKQGIILSNGAATCGRSTRRKTGINDFINDYNLSRLGHLQSFRTFAVVSESSKRLENNYKPVHINVDTKYGLCSCF
jgi:hypothetical protein